MSTDQTPTYVTFKDRKRHPDLWLDDGNIILATDLSIFRVHRSMLSKNSSVFADMFSMPQPMNSLEEPSVEGLPVVVLTDNDADVTHLLNFVYDRR
ncbi:hypothetical protein BD410DRAFT_795113 [Rickenella mellea]|uniref:BTB domain-containing protein n=1 Tax=Rickenella mellea TaxID=50990 RepID=A0A4Y7PMS8_9AGAM|nr:hypothetical protein BD410DRAFT_795113 [Rickenella mellea]